VITGVSEDGKGVIAVLALADTGPFFEAVYFGF
jgi:hypothetical protein